MVDWAQNTKKADLILFINNSSTNAVYVDNEYQCLHLWNTNFTWEHAFTITTHTWLYRNCANFFLKDTGFAGVCVFQSRELLQTNKRKIYIRRNCKISSFILHTSFQFPRTLLFKEYFGGSWLKYFISCKLVKCG